MRFPPKHTLFLYGIGREGRAARGLSYRLNFSMNSSLLSVCQWSIIIISYFYAPLYWENDLLAVRRQRVRAAPPGLQSIQGRQSYIHAVMRIGF